MTHAVSSIPEYQTTMIASREEEPQMFTSVAKAVFDQTEESVSGMDGIFKQNKIPRNVRKSKNSFMVLSEESTSHKIGHPVVFNYTEINFELDHRSSEH